MDLAYVQYVKDWIRGERTAPETIIQYHKRVEEFIEYEKCHNRHSGPE
jgi:hypothetical protein